MDKKRLEKARRLLVDQTPMAFDCGRTCRAACCKSDEEGRGGVFLFPGEEASTLGTDWASVTDAIRCVRRACAHADLRRAV